MVFPASGSWEAVAADDPFQAICGPAQQGGRKRGRVLRRTLADQRALQVRVKLVLERESVQLRADQV